ncbi:class II aldolase/adducin family protein [Dinoroseobacter shibae DFL 12 = DSM 16493]|jgi:ribulose-5-phosphate 4-epimerase/fuculose-1-phosphate aldolase|uniref:Class II aldolase/adducin family protein n=1 Tax=Dinoroseobacter shibae (strain DSM 16493 / NCIMB 14021 / DFL 12) TaxID=398580 RepID=A8LJ89_DINSH|nr:MULTISPECIES: class II aldolase/adducin family protein [Dinoroseobacter]ABV93111.1 class II aldolase/adducin family protein [Dinoroseobacter shibae DFL 12 = DSM 16493]MDD9716213.1 class II aldolase/adducin family protein [Dinoroseobacter sp. PD6]URF48040.1 class II aldolase/adducin family protein [Dinoroseobacter shibae]URF52349.1 class II aldolase/adducin family protein [Dinoroseobacter shibae]
MNTQSRIEETQIRIDLAAALRLSCREGWHEGVANHFSAAVSADGRRFVVNPRWMHWSRVRASDLVLCDADDPTTMDRPDAPDPSAWSIHSALHRELPQARVALHLHPPHATALAALKDPTIHPIDQVTARWYKRLAYDLSFGGIATEEAEGARIAASVGDKPAVMMQNHGVTTFGATVAEAWDAMYHLERAARTMVLAYSTGQPLAIMPDALAEDTAAEWQTYKQAEFAHFAEMKRLLDREAPDYKD